MTRLSQKELLNEGFRSVLKKAVGVAKKGAQAVGAVGGALKSASAAGITAGVGDVAKGAASGWEKTGDMLTFKKKKLEKYLDDTGIMMQGGNPPGSFNGGKGLRGKGKLRVLDIIQYDYTEKGKKIPMEGSKVETRKFKFKDGRWEQVRDKQRRTHEWGVQLDREDIAEAKSDSDHPLKGKVVKHQTAKGGIAYGTVLGGADEYVAINPFKGNKAPGIYGKDETKVEESTAQEATQHYSAPKTEGTSQKDLLRQLTLLRD